MYKHIANFPYFVCPNCQYSALAYYQYNYNSDLTAARPIQYIPTDFVACTDKYNCGWCAKVTDFTYNALTRVYTLTYKLNHQIYHLTAYRVQAKP